MRKGLLTAALLAVAALGLPAAADTVQTPPVTPGMARVWFFRQFQPDQGLRTPMLYINGTPFASSVPGTVFYRDLPAGNYTFSVETCTRDTNQNTSLNLPSGSETELEVQSLSSFHSYGCIGNTTFYVRPITPHIAELYFSQLAYIGPR